MFKGPLKYDLGAPKPGSSSSSNSKMAAISSSSSSSPSRKALAGGAGGAGGGRNTIAVCDVDGRAFDILLRYVGKGSC